MTSSADLTIGVVKNLVWQVSDLCLVSFLMLDQISSRMLKHKLCSLLKLVSYVAAQRFSYQQPVMLLQWTKGIA